MKAFVFTDKALESEAGRFVWLEINTERAGNAPFRTQFKVQALPTYFVVDPRNQRILARRVGGATVAQLREFLDSAHAAYGADRLSPADLASARAESLYAAGEAKKAIGAYQEALEFADPKWTGYERTVEALLFAYQMDDDCESAARLAQRAWPDLRMTAAAANVAATGLDCALELPVDFAGREALIQTMLTAIREVTTDLNLPLVPDDRSSAFGSLIGAYEELGDTTAMHAATEAWALFLDAEAAKATSPEQRTVYDSHRLSAYLELDRPERAIPMLQQSEKDFPDDYNPPARLAVAYLRMSRLDLALAANDRAVARAYGPRKVRILLNRADIFAAKEDATSRQATLQEALSLAESLPDGQRSESLIASLKRRLEKS